MAACALGGISPQHALADSDNAPTLALVGATVIDGTDGPAIESGNIVIVGNRISCVGDGKACPVPPGANTVMLAGLYITPGLVDAHVHFGQTGWIDSRPDGLDAPDVYPYDETVRILRASPERWHTAFLCSGITAAYDVGGQEWTVAANSASGIDRAHRVHVKSAGPLIAHVDHLNRFFLRGTAAQPLFLPMDSESQIRRNVEYLREIGSDAVKVAYPQAPPDRREELDAKLGLIGDLARQAGLPLIVHATELREAKVALRSGATMLVHSVEGERVDQEFLELVVESKAFYVPTLNVGVGGVRTVASIYFGEAVPIDDPNHCVDDATMDRINHPGRLKNALNERVSAGWIMSRLERAGWRQALMQSNLKAVFQAGGRIATGTDAGNPLIVHGPSIYWEMEAMQQAGLPPQDIIIASTRHGAEAMMLADEIGTLEAGKIADLLVLDDDPREDVVNFRSLTHVVRNGVMRRQNELAVR